MEQEIITLKIAGRGLPAITWHLKMIGVQEDQEYTQRFTQLADQGPQKKAEAEYWIYVDALASWSVKMPEVEIADKKDPQKLKTVPLNESGLQNIAKGDNIFEAVHKLLDTRSASREWVAMTTISAFRNSLFPSVTFPAPSA